MAAADDVDGLIERFHQALDEFVKGNPEPCKELFSHREDVTLNNPFGPPARGWDEVAATMDRAASNLTEGAVVGFEEVAKYVTPSSPTPYGWSGRRPRWAEEVKLPRSRCGSR